MIEIFIKTTSGEELTIKIDGKEISIPKPQEEVSEHVTHVLSFDEKKEMWEEVPSQSNKEFVPPPPLSRKKKKAVERKRNKNGRFK
jgi:hypothetical protein